MRARPDPSKNPYYRCLTCPRFRDTCAGKPTRFMTLQEWMECVCVVMDAFRLTNAYVAKEADVSLGTVERIRSRTRDQDIMRETQRRIELVVFGSAMDHICGLDFEASKCTEKIAALESELAAAREEIAYWRKENDRKAKIIDKYLV